MKMLRWVLSHSFLILLIVVVIYGYMYWGNLLGKETPAGKAVAYLSSEFDSVREFVDAVKEKQARLDNNHQLEQQSQPATQTETTEIATVTTSAESDNVSGSDEQVQHKEVTVIGSSPSETIVTEKIVTRTGSHQAESRQPYQHQREQMQAGIQREQQQHEQPQRYERPPAYNMRAQPQYSGSASDAGVTVLHTGQKDVQVRTDQQKNNSESGLSSSTEVAKVANSAAKATTAAKIAVDEGQSDENKPASKGLSSKNTNQKNVVRSIPAEMDTAREGTNDSFVPPEIESQLDNVDKQGRVITQSQENDEIKTSWITARKSFYQRNYELSEKNYRKVIDNTEDNFDAYGELGNVYFNQGKNKQAAAAYFDAAAILIRKGQVVRARSLMELLHHLDESKATELQALIDSEKS